MADPKSRSALGSRNRMSKTGPVNHEASFAVTGFMLNEFLISLKQT